MAKDGQEYDATATVDISLRLKTYTCEIGHENDQYIKVISAFNHVTHKPELNDDVLYELEQKLRIDPDVALLAQSRLYPDNQLGIEAAQMEVIEKRGRDRRSTVGLSLVVLVIAVLYFLSAYIPEGLSEILGVLLLASLFGIGFITDKVSAKARHDACGKFGHKLRPLTSGTGRYCTRCYMQMLDK